MRRFGQRRHARRDDERPAGSRRMRNQLVVSEITAGDFDGIDSDLDEHVDGGDRKRRRYEGEVVPPGAFRNLEMSRAIELELFEELAQRPGWYVGWRRTMRRHELFGFESLQL